MKPFQNSFFKHIHCNYQRLSRYDTLVARVSYSSVYLIIRCHKGWCMNVEWRWCYIIPHGADKWFPWDRGCCWFSARDEVEGGKQTTTEVRRKSYRPKCGINFYHTSYKILVESITLWQRFTPTWNGYELFYFILRHIPLIAGDVVRALRHTYSLILRFNNLKKKSDSMFWPLPFWKYDKKNSLINVNAHGPKAFINRLNILPYVSVSF